MINFKKIIKLIVDIITCILIALVALYLVFAVYNKFINKDGKFLIGKYYIFQIATGSMEHELFAGDYIVVEKTENYKVGDIITYMEDGYYITHRINEIDENMIVTKGDANNSSDSPISRDKIVGKFLFKEKILTFLTKYKVMVIAVLIALVILESAFSKKDDEENKEELLDEKMENNDTNNTNNINDLNNMEIEQNEIIEIHDEEEIPIPIKKEEEIKEDVEII